MRGMHAFLVGVAAVLLAGCVPASSIKPVNSLADLGANEVIIVGKVELDPPLADDEQDLGDSYEEFRNRVLLVTDIELRDASGPMAWGDLGDRIDATLGETFFVAHDAEPFYILKGWVVMRAKVEMVMGNGSYRDGNAPLPGQFLVDVRAGDEAIYIGTIRYTRDDFFGIEKITIVDEHEHVSREFRQRFGKDVKLRKSLARPAK